MNANKSWQLAASADRFKYVFLNFAGAVLIITSFHIIIADSRPFVCLPPIFLDTPSQIPLIPWTENSVGFSSGRQISSLGGDYENVTAVLEQISANWSADDSVIILLTATDVDSKYLPVNIFDELNQHIKNYYVLLQRKGYSLYKVIKKALLPTNPMQTGYHIILKPVGNFSVNFGFTFNFGTSGNLNFS